MKSISLDFGQNAYYSLISPGVIMHNTIGLGEQSVVTSYSDVLPWPYPGASLTDQDAAPSHGLPAETLDTQALASAVSAVLRTSYALFTGHPIPPTISRPQAHQRRAQ